MDSSWFGLFFILPTLSSATTDALFQITETMSLFPNNCPGIVSIPDEFTMSFDLTIDDWSSASATGFIHIYDIDGNNPGAINLRYNDDKKNLYYKFGSNRYYIEAFPIDSNKNGQKMHIETKVTQTHITVTIDDNVELDTDKREHSLLNDVDICFAFSGNDYDVRSIVSGEISDFGTEFVLSMFDASVEREFEGQTLRCAENQPCTVICDEEYACGSSQIICPSNAACDVTCTDIGCLRATITWPDTAGYGSLSCSGGFSCGWVNFPIPDPDTPYSLSCSSYECLHSTIVCPSNADCDISCTEDGCKFNDITWPEDPEDATVICSGDYACQGMIFPIPEPNTDYSLTCGHYECIQATIKCPTDAKCDIECGDDLACTDATIIWPLIAESATLTCIGNSACRGIIHVNEAPEEVQSVSVFAIENVMCIIGVLIVFLSVYIYQLVRYYEGCGKTKKLNKV